MDFLNTNSTDHLVQAARAQARIAAEQNTAMKELPNYQKIETAAQEFEAVFLSEMIKPMFEQIDTDPMFGGGKGEEVFRGMMVQEYGKIMAESGGVGLADFVKAEMLKIQQMQQQTQTKQITNSTVSEGAE